MLEKSNFIASLKLPLAIVGLGVTGESILGLLLEAGLSRDQIATFDKKQAADFQDEVKLIENFRPKTLVVSPGVPLSTPWIQDFLAKAGDLTSELEIAFRFLQGEKVIAVTGSVGKSTTVSLLGAGLAAFTEKYFVGGNLGTPLAEYVCQTLRGRERADWLVLELSSYQLENFKNLIADLSAFVSLTPNHLERYPSLEEYYLSKFALVKKTSGPVLGNRNGGDLFSWMQKKSNSIQWISKSDPRLLALHLEDAQILGAHNQDNLALAASLALTANWPKTSIDEMKKFSGLSHRMENIGIRNGVTFINDSKATTIESVLTAINSVLPQVQGNLHVLLGGRDKNLPWFELQPLAAKKNLVFYFFGECSELAKKNSGLSGESFQSLGPALQNSQLAARRGDFVLLSPGGTSWDEFKNFEDRGIFFRNFISNL